MSQSSPKTQRSAESLPLTKPQSQSVFMLSIRLFLPYFFSASWQGDGIAEVVGKYATDKGYKNMVLIAPNYQAGKDSLAGFKRTFKGQIVGENYTKLGQLDYAAELAEIRAAKPQAVYIFLPGGMGINFIKQYVGAGLGKDTTLLLPGLILPARDQRRVAGSGWSSFLWICWNR